MDMDMTDVLRAQLTYFLQVLCFSEDVETNTYVTY